MASNKRRERDMDSNGRLPIPRIISAELDINYAGLNDKFNNRQSRLPIHPSRIHNNYHSDEEATYQTGPPTTGAGASAQRRASVGPPPPAVIYLPNSLVPIPTTTQRERWPTQSTEHRVPSPPRTVRASRASNHRRFPSPPLPRRVSVSYISRVPSPPPRPSNQPRRDLHHARRKSTSGAPLAPRSREGLNHVCLVNPNIRIGNARVVSNDLPPRQPELASYAWSYGDYSVQRPRTPQPPPPPSLEPGQLAPTDRHHNPSPGSQDEMQEEKRRSRGKSENFKTLIPTHLTAFPWPNKHAASLAPSESRSSLTSSGFLGNQSYQYTPLQDDHFRLVKIFRERKTMIKCEIIHASLENPPSYVAVSYAWGDAGSTRKIELAGSHIPISVSLYGALEALRRKDDSVLVWADALCIDQHNRDERTQQVRLMTKIYSSADSVAIWLGPEENDSTPAIDLICRLADEANSPERVSRLLSSPTGEVDLPAVVALFERDYWRRLWVVQEIVNAKSKTVYCGSSKVPWDVYELASQTFRRHRAELERYYPVKGRDKRRQTIWPNQLSDWQVLVYQGPGSVPDLGSYKELREESLLEVLRACRRKVASDAKDKLFGILGILPEEIQNEFRADYSRSVKDVYTEVVDYLLNTTHCLDVICDAINFPVHTDSANLPSYVPDWSHIPQTTALGHKYNFSASGGTGARCKFLDDRLNKLEISAVYLDTIASHGISVGTLCTLGDYLMAFLHWRALLLGYLAKEKGSYNLRVQEVFCETLSLGQIPEAYDANQWLTMCYHVFSTLLRERLPQLPIDRQLEGYIDARVDLEPDSCREFLQKHFGDQMMGRCFCRTEGGLIGMGSGAMSLGDVVVVPLGCSTPIILRSEGTRGEYRLVGDIYIHGHMYGRAIDEWKSEKRVVSKYVLH